MNGMGVDGLDWIVWDGLVGVGLVFGEWDVCGACWSNEGVGHGEFRNLSLVLHVWFFGVCGCGCGDDGDGDGDGYGYGYGMATLNDKWMDD